MWQDGSQNENFLQKKNFFFATSVRESFFLHFSRNIRKEGKINTGYVNEKNTRKIKTEKLKLRRKKFKYVCCLINYEFQLFLLRKL